MQESINDKLVLEGRKRLSMCGVTAVEGFSEQSLKLSLGEGRVVINGEGIKILSFNQANGNFVADGTFTEIKYCGKKSPFFKKMFK